MYGDILFFSIFDTHSKALAYANAHLTALYSFDGINFVSGVNQAAFHGVNQFGIEVYDMSADVIMLQVCVKINLRCVEPQCDHSNISPKVCFSRTVLSRPSDNLTYTCNWLKINLRWDETLAPTPSSRPK